MWAGQIDDAARRGSGAAARIVGQPYVLHRPSGPDSPVRSATARMQLPALFVPQRAALPSHGHPVFEGVFDSAYTRPGDYLVGADATYFVASRMPLEPVICVRATRRIGLARAPGQTGGGLGGYGGLVRAATQSLLIGWPASVMEAGDGLDRAGLPADIGLGGWSVLLPPTGKVLLQPGDLLTDDLGRAGVIAAAELSDRGWKLLGAAGGDLMADQSDVEQTLAGLVAGLLYPAGDSAMGSGASLVGPPARIYRGWPDPAALSRDLAAGIVNVSVAGDAANQAVTTRYPDDWRLPPPVAPTLSASVAGDTALFAGDAGPGQIAGLLVDGFAAVHRTVAGDTPVTVAEAIAAALASRDAMASGASVLVLGATSILARVVADQPGARETRRQRQVFRLVCWCPDPASRDALAGAIDAALSDVPFVTLPDALAGRLRFVASVPTDRAQAATLYRRDLLYSVEYATSISLGLPTLLFGNAALATAAGVIATHLS